MTEGVTEEFLERVRELPNEAFPREADLSLGEGE